VRRAPSRPRPQQSVLRAANDADEARTPFSHVARLMVIPRPANEFARAVYGVDQTKLSEYFAAARGPNASSDRSHVPLEARRAPDNRFGRMIAAVKPAQIGLRASSSEARTGGYSPPPHRQTNGGHLVEEPVLLHPMFRCVRPVAPLLAYSFTSLTYGFSFQSLASSGLRCITPVARDPNALARAPATHFSAVRHRRRPPCPYHRASSSSDLAALLCARVWPRADQPHRASARTWCGRRKARQRDQIRPRLIKRSARTASGLQFCPSRLGAAGAVGAKVELGDAQAMARCLSSI